MTYILLLVAAFFIELAVNLPVGSLPLLLEREGATREQIALAMGTGMFTALIVSLPIGALSDRIGRLATMKIASAVAFISILGLAFTQGPFMGAICIALRSVAMIAYLTGEFAYGSTIVSKERSISATATLGIIGNFCFALGPACAVWLFQQGQRREQYLWAAGLVILGAFLTNLLPDKHDIAKDTASKAQVMLRKSWIPAIIFAMSCTMQGGVNGSLAVLAFHDRGIINGATIFTAMALTTFFLRFPASRLVENFGPRKSAIPIAAIQAVGCFLAASAHTLPMVAIAGMCLGTAWAAIVPIALALFFEQSSHKTRGAAMGAYNFALGAGSAFGAGIATLYTVFNHGYTEAMSTCALASVCALPLLLLTRKKHRDTPIRINKAVAACHE